VGIKKKTSVKNIFVLAHHGSPEAKGLELVQVLPPVLRAVVRHEEDSFSQLSKSVDQNILAYAPGTISTDAKPRK
jgi:hypothetical protein